MIAIWCGLGWICWLSIPGGSTLIASPPWRTNKITECRSGLDWQNCWLSIWGRSTLIAFLPPPPEDQQNADLGWIDKIVDCQSRVDPQLMPPPEDQQTADLGWIDKIVDCWSGVDLKLMPPQRINRMQIWDGLTKFLIVNLGQICNWCPPQEDQQNADLGWIDKIVHCWSGVDLQSMPPQRINRMQMWARLTKLLIVDLEWIHDWCPHPHPPGGSIECRSGLDW